MLGRGILKQEVLPDHFLPEVGFERIVWEAGMALGQLEGGKDCCWEFIRVGKGGFWNSFGFERMAFGIP